MKLDRDALIVAFNDNSLERSYYLDRENGRVFNLLEDHHDPETEEIAWQIEADGGRRFIQIPKLSMEELMQEQDAFLESLEEGELKTAVASVLETDRDGSAFEEYIRRSKDARDKWRAYIKVRSTERADEWLKSQELDT